MPRCKDLIGQKFNRWLVLKRVQNYKSQSGKQKAKWLCRCDCGNETEITTDNLKYNGSKSCGCLRNEKVKESYLLGKFNYPGKSLDPEISSFNTVYSAYKGSAKNRGYEFNLSKSDFKIFINSNCYYCGDSPKSINFFHKGSMYNYNGIDRLDNKQGYTINNCVSCCKICNIAKRNLTKEQFITHVFKIVENLKNER